MNKEQYSKSQFRGKVEETVRLAENLRNDANNPVDVELSEVVQDKFNCSIDTFYNDLGVDPTKDTISNLFTLGDNDARWLVPEIIRDALRLGLRKAPIWSSITASEQSISGLKAVMPSLNMSEAAPRRVGEAETIPTGTLSYQQKSIDIFKVGRGIKIPYEVSNYVSLDVISIFLQDFGIKLGHALDVLALDVAINGEQASGSESAPVIGTTTGVPGTKAFQDYLRVWIRQSRIGRTPSIIIGGEAAALTTLNLNEFKTNSLGGNQPAGVPTASNLQLQTPIPSNSSYFIHGNIPANQELMIDPTSALMKFNAQPLLVESEKIVSNQTNAFYASLTTGFAKMFRDSTILLDSSQTIVAAPFPPYMDVDPLENVTIE